MKSSKNYGAIVCLVGALTIALTVTANADPLNPVHARQFGNARHAQWLAALRREHSPNVRSTGRLVGSAGSLTAIYQAGPNGVTSISIPTAAATSSVRTPSLRRALRIADAMHAKWLARVRREHGAHVSSMGRLTGSAGSFTAVYQAGSDGRTSVSIPAAGATPTGAPVASAAVSINSWTLLVYTPSYIGPAGRYGTWGGYAVFFADNGNAAWNQVCTKAQDLITGGWVDATGFTCDPGYGTHDTNVSTDSTLFQITVCNRWFSIWGVGKRATDWWLVLRWRACSRRPGSVLTAMVV